MNDDSIAKHMYCHVLSVLLTGQRKKKKINKKNKIKCKAINGFKYVKWYKKSLNYNFKRSYSWGRKDKNRDTAGLNFRMQ